MRILVYEFASGGGLAGQRVPGSIAREGSAMLTALVTDLAALPHHQIVTTTDPRFRLAVPTTVEVVTMSPGQTGLLDTLMASADAVWLVAPETDRCLERLAAKVERAGKMLVGSGAAAIRLASDKTRLPRHLAGHNLPHPETRVLRSGIDERQVARELGYPVVVKPGRGAGCDGVCLARDERELHHAVDVARRADETTPVLLQCFVPGVAASVSLLADGRRAMALATNAQWVRAAAPFEYRGGRTPFDHPLSGRAVEVALRTCEALPGLRGYIGVDLVLAKSEAVIIEVNPRLTTAYLGVRAALEGNLAALALAAWAGALPAPPRTCRRVRFSATRRVGSPARRSSAAAGP